MHMRGLDLGHTGSEELIARALIPLERMLAVK